MKNSQKDNILALTEQGKQVFEYYLGFEVFKKKPFRNPFYHDTHASCYVYPDKDTGIWHIHDFGDNAYTGDCFAFVAMIKQLDCRRDFKRVLQTIIDDLRLNISANYRDDKVFLKQAVHKLDAMPQPKPKGAKPGKSFYDIDPHPFTEAERKYWSDYGIGVDTLEQYNVVALTRFTAQRKDESGRTYSVQSTPANPMFGYVGEGFVKIYRPQDKERRFQYIGTKVPIYCFGYKQLPARGDYVFITGGEKDVLSLAAHNFHAVCFNSETAEIPLQIIDILYTRFRHIIILYDMDETGRKSMEKVCQDLTDYGVWQLQLPLSGEKKEKDISDYFKKGYSASDFSNLVKKLHAAHAEQSLMFIKSCEMDFSKPPESSDVVVSINNVPLGTSDNLLCVAGTEGSGKSHFVSALIAGALRQESALNSEETLGVDILPNKLKKAVLHFDTEQSQAQLYKNSENAFRRACLAGAPKYFHAYYTTQLDRKNRLRTIRESLDYYYALNEGIHLVVIDGVADLVRTANDETESIAVVEELYRLAGMYHTCIVCVVHFVPGNNQKLRGHLGSELTRKSAGIVSIDKDENSKCSSIKAIKVRDGSLHDIPTLQIAWDKDMGMFELIGTKPRNTSKGSSKNEAMANLSDILFEHMRSYSYKNIVESIMREKNVAERTAKDYVSAMTDMHFIRKNDNGLYTKNQE